MHKNPSCGCCPFGGVGLALSARLRLGRCFECSITSTVNLTLSSERPDVHFITLAARGSFWSAASSGPPGLVDTLRSAHPALSDPINIAHPLHFPFTLANNATATEGRGSFQSTASGWHHASDWGRGDWCVLALSTLDHIVFLTDIPHRL